MCAESLMSAGDFHQLEKLGWDRGGDLACSQLLRVLFGCECGWTWVRGSAGTCLSFAAAASRRARAGASWRPSPGAVRLLLGVAGGSLPKPRARLRDDGSPGPERNRHQGGLWAWSRLQACAVIVVGEAGLGTGGSTTPNRAVPESPGVHNGPGPTRSAAARAPGLRWERRSWRLGARGLARPGRGSLQGAGLQPGPLRAALRRAAPRPSNRGVGSPLTSSRGRRGAGSLAPPPALSRTCSAGTPALFSAPLSPQPVTARCDTS